MLNNWLTGDHRIDLPALFGYMGYQLVKKESTHLLFKQMKRCYVVVYTEQGYRYYKVQRPQEKLKASDLVREHVSRVEGSHNESIWDRVNAYYEDILKSKDMVLQGPPDPVLEKVDADFNHFHLYIEQGNAIADNFYSDILGSEKFGTRIGSSKANEVLFPLQNLQNEVCGYFVDTKTGVGDYGESAIGNSLWYSNIPESIDWLIVFKDPREAIAFDKKFRLKNVVYLALGEINYDTTRILFQIQRLTKLKKIVLTFTGSKKIEGYLRDLHFISLMDDSNFLLTLNERDLSVRFDIGEEKSFLRFFNSTKKFNQGLAKSFLNYNKVINQNLINQNSILVSKEDDNIKVRVPLEVNAIKYFVWSYFKNYLSKSLDILKPTYANWNSEWEATQSIQLKGKEVQPEDYRIAL